jgi:hypothetical protein
MSTFKRKTGEHEVVVTCDASLEPQATSLLDTLAKMELAPDQTVQFGFAMLRLRSRGGALHVVQGDYQKDPETDERDAIDEVLIAITEQVMLANKLGVSPADVRDMQTAKGVLEWPKLPRKYFFRARAKKKDSGWRIASPEEPAAPNTSLEVEYTFIYDLLNTCRAVFPALALPEGWTVLVEGDRIVAITDEEGTRRGP